MGSTEMLPSPAHLSKEFAFMTNANDSLLRDTTERRGLAVLLCAGGEIDASNVRTWRQIVRAAAHATAAPGPLVVDTSGLDFMPVCAFGVLVEASQQCRARGIELRLVSSQPITARIIAAARLQAELPLYLHKSAALHPPPRRGLPHRQPNG